VALSDSPLAVAGSRVHGHEFHRTVCDPPAGTAPAWGWRETDGPRTEGFTTAPNGPAVHASYLHLHWTGAPALPLRLVQHAAAAAELTRRH
jgi:cobyrinic acid a,c-diamide synthase